MVLVHGNLVVGPIISASSHVAKFAAAERALAILKNSESDRSLFHLCNCAAAMDAVSANDDNTLNDFLMLSVDSAVEDPSRYEDENEVVRILMQTGE